MNRLFDIAVKTALNKWPKGEANAAAALTGTGKILTSVWVEAACDAACLCAETGAICEAHKLGETIVAILYVERDDMTQEFLVKPACGICQERLAIFGLDVKIGIAGSCTEAIFFKTLRELRPHYWRHDL